ncbi:MAG: hypothetical protein GX654_20575 [Desulfatiglans sp.]|nr:hypothetical protein [Desulfatiglans sp.]
MNPIKYARFFFGNITSQFGSADDTKPLDQLIKEAKEYFDPMLPRNADADTRLDSIEIDDRQLIMNSTLITATKDDINIDEFPRLLRRALRDEAYRRKRLKRILKKVGTLVYRYEDMNGDYVTEIGLCERLK